jgi:hypothetical protein
MLRGISHWVSTDRPGHAPLPGNVWAINHGLYLLQTSGEQAMESCYEDRPL